MATSFSVTILFTKPCASCTLLLLFLCGVATAFTPITIKSATLFRPSGVVDICNCAFTGKARSDTIRRTRTVSSDSTAAPISHRTNNINTMSMMHSIPSFATKNFRRTQMITSIKHYNTKVKHLKSQKTSTQLQMVTTTKSGGRPIESKEDFQAQVLSTENTKPILVFYSAPWCGPCRLSNPVVKDIIKLFGVGTVGDGSEGTEFKDEGGETTTNKSKSLLDVVEICTDDLPDVAEDAGVVSIPTIQIYYQGELMDTIVGCVAKNVLASAVKKVLEDVGLDVNIDA